VANSCEHYNERVRFEVFTAVAMMMMTTMIWILGSCRFVGGSHRYENCSKDGDIVLLRNFGVNLVALVV
jgi:hypothetical protein